ncbi:MAG: phospholipase D-like domain-containing protein [bacterium]|nr:phospholipase D-like domain-containing protein [bacterium]
MVRRTGVILWACASVLLAAEPRTPAPAPAQEIVPVVNAEYLPALLAIIGRARTGIDFIQLMFHYDPAVRQVQDALREAHGRGVRVRGLIDDGIGFNATSVKYLREFGIDAKLDTPEKMTHNKLFIVDGECVLLGSSNLSRNSMERNNETNVLIRDRAVGGFFGRYFERLWEDSAREPGLEPLAVGALRIVTNRDFFPEVHRLFSEAKDSIEVLMYGVNYSPGSPDSKANRLVDALADAARRKVKVRVMLDKSDYNEAINEVNRRTRERLDGSGVEVRWDDEHVTTHAKLLIVDGLVVIGSYNWGYDALERRNECAVVIRDDSVRRFFSDYFTTLWEGRRWRPPAEGRAEP